jgi:hypothetical protein
MIMSSQELLSISVHYKLKLITKIVEQFDSKLIKFLSRY